MEQQLLTTRDNARFLLSLAPLVEDARPENLDIGSFMEEAMEVDIDSKWQEIRCWLLYCKDNLMLYETILGPKVQRSGLPKPNLGPFTFHQIFMAHAVV